MTDKKTPQKNDQDFDKAFRDGLTQAMGGNRRKAAQMSDADILSLFAGKLKEVGLLFDSLIPDGNMHYTGTRRKPKSQNGRYKIHMDRPATVWFFNRDEGYEDTLTATDRREWTPEDWAKDRARREREKAMRAEAARIQQTEAAQKAQEILSKARPADADFPYLKAKSIKLFGGISQGQWYLNGALKPCLILPIRQADGRLTSLQFIFEDGNKRFLGGGVKKAGFLRLPADEGKAGGPLYLGEGYATCCSVHEAVGHEVLVAFDAGNLEDVARAVHAHETDRQIIVCADWDEPCDLFPAAGGTGRAKADSAARAVNGLVVYPRREGGAACDWNDLAKTMGTDEVAVQLQTAHDPSSLPDKTAPHKLRVINIAELLSMDVPPREYVLFPIIPTQGLVMLFAFRGTGKTFLGFYIAFSVACGGVLFQDRWYATKARRVLYIDGEMPLATVQKRFAELVGVSDNTLADPDNLRILTPDVQPDFVMPNIATDEGQRMIEPYLDGVELVVVDNLATLARTGKANDEDSWAPVQGWLLSLRRRGISALIVHHESKNGSQRGTVAKEDILDTVIRLTRPKDYEPSQGARFNVELTKARGILGEDAEGFEAALTDGRWAVRPIEQAHVEAIKELAETMTVREIAEELSLSKTKVSRLCKQHGISTRGHGVR